MTEHYALIRIDYDYINALRARGVALTQDHWDDAWTCHLACSDPHNCPGWQECREDHRGYDFEDEESPAFDQEEDVMIHGEPHDWRDGWGWTVAAESCPVLSSDAEPPDEVPLDRYGTYLLDDDWDDTVCYLEVVREVSDEGR